MAVYLHTIYQPKRSERLETIFELTRANRFIVLTATKLCIQAIRRHDLQLRSSRREEDKENVSIPIESRSANFFEYD